MTPPRNRLSPERRATAAQRWISGWSWERLAAACKDIPRDTLRDICAATGARQDDLPKPRIHGRPWTREETQQLAEMLARRVPQAEMAARLKRTEHAIKGKLEELRHRAQLAKQATPTTTRTCLCCRRPFASEGPHNRICNTCKANEAWRGYTPLRETGGVRVR